MGDGVKHGVAIRAMQARTRLKHKGPSDLRVCFRINADGHIDPGC